MFELFGFIQLCFKMIVYESKNKLNFLYKIVAGKQKLLQQAKLYKGKKTAIDFLPSLPSRREKEKKTNTFCLFIYLLSIFSFHIVRLS
jgi:hypothetical protein